METSKACRNNNERPEVAASLRSSVEREEEGVKMNGFLLSGMST